MTHQSINLKSPLGLLRIECGPGGIRALMICEQEGSLPPNADIEGDAVFTTVKQQLNQFFFGRLRAFDLPIDFSNYSLFAVEVLQALQTVPCGETVSYGELATLAGHQGAARAVGRVVGANRTPILIPCHRVIGSNGDLVGYSATGGVKTKRWLLDFEQQVIREGVKV